MSGFFLVGSVMSIVALAVTGAVDGHTCGCSRCWSPPRSPDIALSR